MGMTGETKPLATVSGASASKAELGAVSEDAVEVVQSIESPESVTVVQPGGKAGGVEPSKFWVKLMPAVRWPILELKLRVPRLAVPS